MRILVYFICYPDVLNCINSKEALITELITLRRKSSVPPLFKLCIILFKYHDTSFTPHPPAQRAPYHLPESPLSSSPHYREMAISNHLPPPAYLTTAALNVYAVLEGESLCTPSVHVGRGCSKEIVCRRCRESCAMRA
jgi:hypothetical protein